MKRLRFKGVRLAILGSFIVSVILFQNCGRGFEVNTLSSASSLGTTGNSVDVPTDPTQPFSVYVRSASAPYGSDLNFKIELNKASSSDVAVALETRDGTAKEGADYAGAKFSATIVAGSLETTVKVSTMATGAILETRKFTLKATSVSAGVLAQSESVATILATKRLLKLKDIAASPYSQHVCGLTEDGQVKCWGSNTAGQLGQSTALKSIDVPTLVGALKNIKQVTVGTNHTCVLTEQNSVKCWGDNQYGQLGNGTKTNSTTPVDVVNVSNIQQLSSSYYSNVALDADGTAKIWGQNGSNNPYVSPATPVEFTPFKNAKSISAGLYSHCAVSPNNDSNCFSFFEGFKPFETAQLMSGLKSISIGEHSLCALTNNGTAKCVGGGLNDGQLGGGTLSDGGFSPVDVVGLVDLKQVVAGFDTNCALTAQNTVKCWGTNRYKLLGIETLTASGTPLDITGLNAIKKVVVGFQSACALGNDGTVKCWGRSNYGVTQLAAGVATATPVSIVEPMP